MCVCMYVGIYVCMYICMYICMYVGMYVCRYVCMYVCMYVYVFVCMYICMYVYRVSQEECTKLRESVPYVELYRYNPKHLYSKLNGYGDNGQRSFKL